MRLAFEIDGQRHIREVQGSEAGLTLGALVTRAFGVASAQQDIYVDGQAIRSDTLLSDVTLLEGSTVSLSAGSSKAEFGSWCASISGGMNTGLIIELPQHRPVLAGRSPHADIQLETASASWEHASFSIEKIEDGSLAVRIKDAGSTNGTYVNGERLESGDTGLLVTQTSVVALGGVTILLRPELEEKYAPAPGTLHNLTANNTAPFNRPPRATDAVDNDPLAPPERKEVTQASKFSYITVIAPIVMAVALVLMMGNLRFAVFALMSPIMAIGMWFEQKRRYKKNLLEEEERFAGALEEFKASMTEASSREAARRAVLAPESSQVIRTASFPATRLWQRRAGDQDVLALNTGTGNSPWRTELPPGAIVTNLDKAVRKLHEENTLTAAPVITDLSNAGVVGIVGDREGALALARSLVIQAAVHVGPADLRIAVFCDKGRAGKWNFASWLPQVRRLELSTGELWLSDDSKRSKALLKDLRDQLGTQNPRHTLMVLDSEVLTEGRDAPARALLGHGRLADPTRNNGAAQQQHQISGIVIATEEHLLPAACNTVIHVADDAEAKVEQRIENCTVEHVSISGLGIEQAELTAQNLARFDDPELVVSGAGLPQLSKLPDLLGLEQTTPAEILKLWSTSKGFSTPVGVCEAGDLSLDLVKDGPHGLVGGTTGSGKSEFLRSLVAGLAARNDPTKLNFILVDFKGGAAFAACEALPHTIGTISNLDEQLALRALEALEAEMERRQRLFAEAGEDIDNLDAYLKTGPAEPMPRLLLVVDEFAMLAKEFPDVLKSLVSVGAVGRTLGVHMILATQRPAGVVTEDILANTNLRVALRVQSRDDSNNVIGVPHASGINRSQMGRAFVKLGQDDITAVQTALVTGRAVISSSPTLHVLEPGHFGSAAEKPKDTSAVLSAESDLDLLIEAIRAANDELGIPKPRHVWPEALGERVELSGFSTSEEDSDGITVGSFQAPVLNFALRDEPSQQRQVPAGWDISTGNLLLVGIPGSGTSTALATIALTACLNESPDELDLLVLDMSARTLGELERLAHTAAYVSTGHNSKEKQARFLRHIASELSARKADPHRRKRTLVLVDGLVSLREEFDSFGSVDGLLEGFMRAYAEGPALGMHFAVSSSINTKIPTSMNAVTIQKWVFKLSDRTDYSSLGIKGSNIPAPLPGRCVDVGVLKQMHVAMPATSLAKAADIVEERWSGWEKRESLVRNLPTNVNFENLKATVDLNSEPWRIPVGMREDNLQAASLEIYPQEHALIAGPARSGKSSLLIAIAQSLESAGADCSAAPVVWGICDKRSPLATAGLKRVISSTEDISQFLNELMFEDGPRFLLIDDVEKLEDRGNSLEQLLKNTPEGLCIIAAGRSAELRSIYSWQKLLRGYGSGIILQPDPYKDQSILGIDLPGRSPVELSVGRGYLHAGGQVTLIQSMSPSELALQH